MSEDPILKKYRKLIKDIPVLSWEEEKKLITKVQRGNRKAKDEFLKIHFRSVINVVSLYKNRGIAIDDLVDEGNLGILRALKTYDLKKGIRFISYASWWMRHYMLRLIYQQTKAMKIPIKKLANRKAFIEAERELSQKLGRLPSTEEIAEVLGISSHEVNEAMGIAQADISLDTTFGEDSEFILLDFIESDEEALDSNIDRKVLAGEISGRFGELGVKERRVLELRFGLRGKTPHTLEEIGHKMALSRERIRQIETKALNKLRRLIG